MIQWSSLLLTFKLALITTLLLLLITFPLAYWLAFTKKKWKVLVETLISMPLVLPPTVIGFYLLITFSPNNFLGQWLLRWFNIQFVFSFEGLILGSIIYSLPFMVHPIQAGLTAFPKSLIDASYVLGKSKAETLFKVLLPNIKKSILTAIVLTFAHTIGEFGVVLMIGGNIPQKTRVASIAIYNEVESLNYTTANTYSFILFSISFSILLLVFIINRKPSNLFLK